MTLMRTPTATLLALLCILPLSAQDASGQQADGQAVPAAVYGDKAPFQVVFDHVTGDIRVESPKGELIDSWTADAAGRTVVAPLFSVPTDRPVAVRIENANPLLYNYAVRAETVREASLQSCSQVSRGFNAGAVLGALGTAQMATVSGMGLVDMLAKDAPAADFSGLGAGDEGAAFANAAALADLVETIAPDVEAYLDVVEPFVAASISLPDSLRVIASLSDGQPAGPLLDELRASLQRSLRGASSAADVAGALRKTVDDYGHSVGLMHEAAAAVSAQRHMGSWANRATALSIRLGELDQATIDAASVALQTAHYMVEVAQRAVTQTYVTAPNPNYRRIRIELTRTGEYPDVPGFKEGVDVFTEPAQSVLCSLSIGFTFMDRPAEYMSRDGSVAPAAPGDDLRTTASLMLHVGAPSVPFLRALVGAGIGTQGMPDLYLGGSLSILQPLLLNAGWVFQRSQQLPTGSRIGDPFPAAYLSADEFPKSWKGGFFFGVSLHR
jgi:hypothetical protein